MLGGAPLVVRETLLVVLPLVVVVFPPTVRVPETVLAIPRVVLTDLSGVAARHNTRGRRPRALGPTVLSTAVLIDEFDCMIRGAGPGWVDATPNDLKWL